MAAASSCRLYLITPPLSVADLDAFAPRFAEALGAGDVASALVRIAPAAEGDAKRILQRLVELAAARDVATLVENDARLAARVGADGAHIAGVGAELTEALASLHPERIVGAGGLRSRDDAMSAGEAGADYVMFGEPRRDGYTPPARRDARAHRLVGGNLPDALRRLRRRARRRGALDGGGSGFRRARRRHLASALGGGGDGRRRRRLWRKRRSDGP